ncbi:uncharacterized protein LOC144664998 [Oculina patagonica]
MGKICLMAFSLFFMSVVLASAIADRCQIVLMNRCIKGYQKDLSATSESVGGHCYRMERALTCLISEPKCRGELIEKFRYWILQMAMMDKILGTCENNDFTALKSIVQESAHSQPPPAFLAEQVLPPPAPVAVADVELAALEPLSAVEPLAIEPQPFLPQAPILHAAPAVGAGERLC